jgi:hypothetical protein
MSGALALKACCFEGAEPIVPVYRLTDALFNRGYKRECGDICCGLIAIYSRGRKAATIPSYILWSEDPCPNFFERHIKDNRASRNRHHRGSTQPGTDDYPGGSTQYVANRVVLRAPHGDRIFHRVIWLLSRGSIQLDIYFPKWVFETG